MQEGVSMSTTEYSVLDTARLPFAVLAGPRMILFYANNAFCALIGKSNEKILGQPFSKLMPEDDGCLLLLDQVFRNGKCETHTIHVHSEPHPSFWTYEIWPIWTETEANGIPFGLVFQVTETASLHERIAVMNEALLLSSVRQHELVEKTETLNEKLTAEIKERKRVELEIEQLAFYDPLTDLPNRRLLMDRLHHAILRSCRTMNHGAIFFIDLDHFKSVNDTRGHHLGDLLLQQVAQRLRDCVREGDTVARLGGDEFVVMAQELSDNFQTATLQAKNMGIKLLSALNQPYLLAGREHHCSGSIGITLFGKNRETVGDLLKRADMAQYRAKTGGGDSIRMRCRSTHDGCSWQDIRAASVCETRSDRSWCRERISARIDQRSCDGEDAGEEQTDRRKWGA